MDSKQEIVAHLEEQADYCESDISKSLHSAIFELEKGSIFCAQNHISDAQKDIVKLQTLQMIRSQLTSPLR